MFLSKEFHMQTCPLSSVQDAHVPQQEISCANMSTHYFTRYTCSSARNSIYKHVHSLLPQMHMYLSKEFHMQTCVLTTSPDVHVPQQGIPCANMSTHYCPQMHMYLSKEFHVQTCVLTTSPDAHVPQQGIHVQTCVLTTSPDAHVPQQGIHVQTCVLTTAPQCMESESLTQFVWNELSD